MRSAELYKSASMCPIPSYHYPMDISIVLMITLIIGHLQEYIKLIQQWLWSRKVFRQIPLKSLPDFLSPNPSHHPGVPLLELMILLELDLCQQLLVLFRVSRVHCHSTSAIDDFTCEPENIVSLNAEILGVCLYTSFVFYLKERLPPIIGVKMFSPPYFSRASLFSKADTKCSEATLRNCDQLQMGGMTLRSWASRQKTRKSWAISRASDPS